MNTPVKYALVFALLACLLAPLAAAVDVTITVIDKDGDPIEDADVNMTNSTDTVCDGTTNDDGEVDCGDIESDDDYQIKVSHDDYQQIDDDKTLDDFDNDWKDVAVVMRPKTFDLTVHVCAGGIGSSCGSGSEDIEGADVTIESADVDMLPADYDDFDSDDTVFVFPGKKTKYTAFEVGSDDDSGETDDDGEVTLENLEFNTDYNITVKKSGYPTMWVEYEFPDKAKDASVDIKLVEPGTATVTAVVYDQATNELISGASVVAVNKATGAQKTGQTNSRGAVELKLSTPGCYDITASKEDYGSDTAENQCFENDDRVPSLPLFLVSQNRGPTANAGADQYILVGTTITLDASGSSDPDDDDLTYSWVDLLGIAIPSIEKPPVLFNVAGEHVITLTVSDGTEESTDTVIINVESRENCGDSFCSLAENSTDTCPQDCPVCPDNVRGAGECFPNSTLYCPIDCNIPLKISMLNTTVLVPGNATVISLVDPFTGEPVLGAALQVTFPNGSSVLPRVLMGRADVTFPVGGAYTINASAPNYVSASTTVEIQSSADWGWLLWLVIIVVLALVLIRLINMLRMQRGAKGYRAKSFRRSKPTLSRI